jgi:hypothetical protein
MRVQLWVEFWCGSSSDSTTEQDKMLKTNLAQLLKSIVKNPQVDGAVAA